MTILTNLIILGTIILCLYVVFKLGFKWLVKAVVFGIGGAAAGFAVGYVLVSWVCAGTSPDALCGWSAGIVIMLPAILGGLAVGIYLSVRFHKSQK